MAEALSLIGIGIIAFASTNIDDLVLLMALFADPAYRPALVVVGQYAGIAALIALSLLGSLLALVVPTGYIGLIGFVPIALGVRGLLRGPEADEDDDTRRTRRGARVATVTLLTLSNGGDNLSLYIPLFAVHSAVEITLLAAIFLAMTALWCIAGYVLVSRRALGVAAQRQVRAVLPCVMIGLGLYIFAKTGALALLAEALRSVWLRLGAASLSMIVSD
jgi:cadmium resistance protein CadD (predicted permease)